VSAVPVVVGKAVQKDVPLELQAIGNVEAYEQASVKSQIEGQIVSVFFSEGQDVKKGDLLFRIDPRPYEAALRQAEATLAKDLAQAKNAEKDAKRYALLIEKDLIAKEQYEQVQANADALAALVNADRAAVEQSTLQLEYCTILSPFDGRVGSLLVNRGNVVKANDTVLLTINKITPIYVSFAVPEKNLLDVRKYMKAQKLRVEAVIPGDEEHPQQGVLTFIDNAVNSATGTIQMKGTFENGDKKLWPGQFVNVRLVLSVEHGVIVVPSQAVQTGQSGQYVYVIKPEMTAESRPVKTERTHENETVILEGLNPGETVVTDGQLRLVTGVKVEIANSSQGGNK
jgi:multidrug efflux system membrane fusion protein